MKTITLMMLLVATLLFGNTSTAGAEDFTFNVPVHLKEIPANVTSLRVICGVSTEFPSLEIGVGQTSVKMPADGNFSQDVVVKVNVNAASGKNPADAKKYYCILHLQTASGFMNPTNPGAIALGFGAKPGTNLVQERDGTLPTPK